MNLLDLFNPRNKTLQQLTISEVLKANKDSQSYNLTLSEEEAKEVIETRNRVIQSYGRVELGIEVIRKIIAVFSASSYITCEDYASTINELVEIFYYMKSETEDRIGDNELIYLMWDLFNNSCGGSLELLKDREFDMLMRNFRLDTIKL